jgi:plastocyanin
MNRRTFLTQLAGAGAATAGGIATTGHARGQGTTHTIGMYTKGGSYYFDPIGLYVKPGDTVKWVIKSGGHSATSYTKGNPSYSGPSLIPKKAKPWNSGVLNKPGASFSYTFKAKGTYKYYCIPHKSLGMVGKIVCGAPGGPGENNSIPSSDKPEGLMPPSDILVQRKKLGFPYIPGTDHGGPPALFWGGLTAFTVTSIYLFGVYDRTTGRYNESPDDELNLGMGSDAEKGDDD